MSNFSEMCFAAIIASSRKSILWDMQGIPSAGRKYQGRIDQREEGMQLSYI